MANRVDKDGGRSKSIGGQVEGNHRPVADAGSEKPGGWNGTHNVGATSGKKMGGKSPAKDTNSGDL